MSTPACHLGAGTRPLDECLVAEIDRGNLERRVAEFESRRRPTRDLSHADLTDPGIAQR